MPMETETKTPPHTAVMTPRDWFALLLRAFGVWELLNACDQAVTILNINAGIWKPIRTEMGAYVTHALMTFLIGIWLLKSAPTIARLFYPAAPTDSKPSSAPLA